MSKNSIRAKIIEELARALTESRIRKGLSLNEMSQRAGLGRTTVSYIERGLRSPSFDSLIRLAEVLEVELSELVKEAVAKAKRPKQGS